MRSWVRWGGIPAAALLIVVVAAELGAQQRETATVSGRVTDENGVPISGAQIVVTNAFTGSRRSTVSGEDGGYLVPGLAAGGPYLIEARRIGYGMEIVAAVRVAAGQTRTVDFALPGQAVAIDAIEVFASRAIERRTPVAHSNVDKIEIQRRLGSRDIPLILNATPSVYATAAGGGAGDARVNVRGFNQRNVAVMLNGVPINDMENGWVYWSNWDGVGDATSSIQLQRGLSAVNLATPSVGGTLNIITDAAAVDPVLSLQQEFGNDGFLKTTVTGATGLIDDRLALTVSGVRKQGDGLIEGTWTDAWAYYLAGSYIIDDANRLELVALGGPQRHGQNLDRQNVAAYSHAFARDLEDYDPAALARFPEADARRAYNQNVAPVECSYDGLQAVGEDTFERFECGFLNERENFYHKPVATLNWYSELSDQMLWSTVAYYSGGSGGGTGIAGDVVWDESGPSRVADWDATVAMNRGVMAPDGSRKRPGRSAGILRNSRNRQWTIGAISKLRMRVGAPVRVQLGVDWRTAEIEHYREVRDLLGGDYWVKTADEFNPNEQVGLGDKIDYDFTNTVDWLGASAQAEFTRGAFSAYGMAGLSTIEYTYTNHFRDDGMGDPVMAETGNIWGYQVKGGGLYNLTEHVDVYANAGYVSRVPIFDGVIDDVGGQVNANPENEKFMAVEGGLDYRAANGELFGRLSLYRTTWNDRTLTRNVILAGGTEGLVSLTGLNALHQGVELELAYQPEPVLRFDVSASFGDWSYTDDVGGRYRPDDRSATVTTYDFYVDGLKVGDSPQTQLTYAAALFPSDEIFVQALGRTYARHYADFEPFDRTDPTDRAQSWQTPAYTVFDLHGTYDLPLATAFPVRVQLFASVFNLFDTIYIQDALDNSPSTAFDGDHDADDAEVYLGLPRTFNIGARITY